MIKITTSAKPTEPEQLSKEPADAAIEVFQAEFNSGIVPFDDEIEQVRQQYCASSGRPLAKVPHDVVANLITIHGRMTTIKILQTQQIKYSYDWIWLNHEGLDNLAEHRPAEYFIYATSKLLQDCTLHSELMRLHEAADAWRKLQTIDKDILIPINELLRRMLANYKRDSINKYLNKFTLRRVDRIATNLDNLLKFQIELTDLIQLLVAKQKKQDQIEQGMSMFRGQRMIKALSVLEVDIGKELNDFDIVDGKTSEVIHAITGTSYRHSGTKAKAKVKQYSTEPVKKKAFAFKLNLGDK